MTRKQKKRLYRILAASAGILLVELLPVDGLLRLALYLCVYFVIGSDVVSKAIRGIVNGSVFDENFLMAVATVGAFVLAIITRSGDYLAVLSDWRAFPKLRRGKEQKEHQRPDGHPAGLCQH